MRRLFPLALIGLAAGVLISTPQDALIFGLDHGAFARAAIGVVLLLWLLFAGARRVGPRDVARVVGGAATWAALTFALVGVYAYRFEFSDLADRVLAELNAAEPVVGPGGEVVVTRRLGGQFVIAAKVNNAPASFLFDTGASTVVLRAQDAGKLGIDPAELNFNVSVTTANGSARAAETRIDQLAVGPIVMRNVRALVAQPGALSENLLGMSFLERLQSYSVERGRLILKAK